MGSDGGTDIHRPYGYKSRVPPYLFADCLPALPSRYSRTRLRRLRATSDGSPGLRVAYALSVIGSSSDLTRASFSAAKIERDFHVLSRRS